MYHLQTFSAGQSRQTLKKILSSVPGTISKIWDIQPIVGVNEKSEVSRSELNTFLQGYLNPKGEVVPGSKFRIGDKVIRVSQNTHLPLFDSSVNCIKCGQPSNNEIFCQNPQCKSLIVYEVSKVANGEMGKVVAACPNKWFAFEIDSPKRTVRVDFQGGKNSQGTITDFDLGYAITCHKSQGSQWKIVVVMVDDGARMIANREWHYTAVSRASLLGFTIGKTSTVNQQIQKIGLKNRKTFLKELLIQEHENNAKGVEENGIA